MRKRDRRVRNIPVSQIIPNMITSGSIFWGVSSMSYVSRTADSGRGADFLRVFFDLWTASGRSLGGGPLSAEDLDSLRML